MDVDEKIKKLIEIYSKRAMIIPKSTQNSTEKSRRALYAEFVKELRILWDTQRKSEPKDVPHFVFKWIIHCQESGYSLHSALNAHNFRMSDLPSYYRPMRKWLTDGAHYKEREELFARVWLDHCSLALKKEELCAVVDSSGRYVRVAEKVLELPKSKALALAELIGGEIEYVLPF